VESFVNSFVSSSSSFISFLFSLNNFEWSMVLLVFMVVFCVLDFYNQAKEYLHG
jgi:hypothetical protein